MVGTNYIMLLPFLCFIVYLLKFYHAFQACRNLSCCISEKSEITA